MPEQFMRGHEQSEQVAAFRAFESEGRFVSIDRPMVVN